MKSGLLLLISVCSVLAATQNTSITAPVSELDIQSAQEILKQCAKRTPIERCIEEENKCPANDVKCYCRTLMKSFEQCLPAGGFVDGKCDAAGYDMAKKIIRDYEVAACKADGLTVEPLNSAAAASSYSRATLSIGAALASASLALLI